MRLRVVLQRLGEGVFVRAGAVDGRHRHIEQPQIDRQLAAVVVHVVEHDGADEGGARDGHNRLAVARHGPQAHQAGVVH